MRITILFLGRNGAGPKYAYEMTKSLSENSDDIFQVIVPENIDNKSDWNRLKYPNLSIEFVKTYNNKLEYILSLVNFPNLKLITNKIKKYNPHVIYLPMGSLLNFALLPLLKQYKIIYTLHDPELHSGERNFFIELLKKIEIKHSNKLILLNNYYKEFVSKKYNVNNDNIEIIPHAGFFSSSIPSFEEDFKYKILFLGRIEKYKGIDLLLDSIPYIREKVPHIKITLAGKGDLSIYQEKINNVIENIDIKNYWISDHEVNTLLKNHDFLILPYIDASQSGVIPLALGNGKTVIATNVGALSEQIPNNIGFCVDPDVDEISKSVISIYCNGKDYLNGLNRRAYQYAITNLTWKSSSEKLLKIANSIKL